MLGAARRQVNAERGLYALRGFCYTMEEGVTYYRNLSLYRSLPAMYSPQMFSGFSRFIPQCRGCSGSTYTTVGHCPYVCEKDMNPDFHAYAQCDGSQNQGTPWRLTTSVSPSHVRRSLIQGGPARLLEPYRQVVRIESRPRCPWSVQT